MREELEQITYAQGGPFRTDQARHSGVSPGRFRSDRAAGRWRQLRRSIYVDATLADLVDTDQLSTHVLHIAAAGLRLAGDPVASFESAALLWGVDTLGRISEVQLTRARRRQGTADYPGVRIQHSALPAGQVAQRHGVAVTTVARTVMDIARVRPFRAGVVAADCALRKALCTREELLLVAEKCTRWPGIRRARAVVEFADTRSESPLESISRVAFHEYGLPAPALQEWVTPHERVDFLWKKARVIGEADGMGKYTSPDVLRFEKDRQELLERLGYRFVRWGWRDVYQRPDAVAYWVNEALHRR